MYYTTPRSAALLLIPRPRAAANDIARQLRRKPENLKKATREMDRSSCGVRDEAKMERRTAGVTGMRREESDGGCRGVGLAVVVVPLVDEEEAMF